MKQDLPEWLELCVEGLPYAITLLVESCYRLSNKSAPFCAYPAPKEWMTKLAERIVRNTFQVVVAGFNACDSDNVRAAGSAQGLILNAISQRRVMEPDLVEFFDVTEENIDQLIEAFSRMLLPSSVPARLEFGDRQKYLSEIVKGSGAIMGEDGNLQTRLGNSDLHWVLLCCWEIVDGMDSVGELYRWLSAQTLSFEIGDQSVLEGICRKIGLKFRGRGRPKKNTD